MNLIPSSHFPIPINFYTEFFLRTHFTLLACSNMDISNLTIFFFLQRLIISWIFLNFTIFLLSCFLCPNYFSSYNHFPRDMFPLHHIFNANSPYFNYLSLFPFSVFYSLFTAISVSFMDILTTSHSISPIHLLRSYLCWWYSISVNIIATSVHNIYASIHISLPPFIDILLRFILSLYSLLFFDIPLF